MTTILITPAVVQALRAWNSDVARARHEYETAPTRSCRWANYAKPCSLLRREDPTYCNKHRAAANKRAAKKAEWRRMDRARRKTTTTTTRQEA